MTNTEALRAQCKLICNICYVDDDVLSFTLANHNLNAEDEAVANDVNIITAALQIIRGWVESSRSEIGISTSINTDAIKQSMIYWCKQAGLDASDYIDDYSSITNISELW